MYLRDVFLKCSPAQWEEIAKKAGTNYPYLYQVSRGYATPSVGLAKNIVKAAKRCGWEVSLVEVLNPKTTK